jgi:D-alanyl-D-alanine carboxypeptidase-like protein
LVKANSPYHLDDPVTISALAADTGGSRMGLTTGYPPLAEDDVMPLELLLYGMMLESCNKSAVAIAQYFTGETEGYGIWTNRMNQRAAALGMTMTLYTTPPGGCITTPQDQVTLWRHGWQYPLFRQFVSEKLYYDCGVDAQGLPKCYDVVKFSDSGYPGLDGWKSGNGGSGPQFGVPWCTEAAVRQATRLDRSMIVALSQTANKETDGDNLFDYGYRLLFTPDYMGGSGMNLPPINDFAVRKIHDTLGVTALIYGGDQLRLDTWQLVTGIGQVGHLNNTAITIENLAPGTHAIRPASLDAVRLPSIEAQADYFTGHLEGTALRLNLWRILPEP